MALRLASAFVAVSMLGLIAVAAFWIGRASMPAPRFEAGARGEDPLADAWSDFERAQRDALALLRDHDFYGDAQERAEAHRDVLYALVGAIEVGVLLDPEHPHFLRTPHWTSKTSFDNPDEASFVALLRDDADYRVTGTRGTTSSLTFQVLAGHPGVGDASTRESVAVLDDRALATDADGRFEVILSRRDPGAERNWLRMAKGATTLLVRHAFSDWERERAGTLAIERIGGEARSAEPLGEEAMATQLRAAASILLDREATWLDYAQRAPRRLG
jgi:hypothetical protein